MGVDNHAQCAIEAVVLFWREVVELLKRDGFVALQESVPGVLELLDLPLAAPYGYVWFCTLKKTHWPDGTGAMHLALK